MHEKLFLNLKHCNVLQILKYEEPEPTSEDEDDHDIQSLNKKIERQESSVSSIRNYIAISIFHKMKFKLIWNLIF